MQRRISLLSATCFTKSPNMADLVFDVVAFGVVRDGAPQEASGSSSTGKRSTGQAIRGVRPQIQVSQRKLLLWIIIDPEKKHWCCLPFTPVKSTTRFADACSKQ